MTFEWDDPFDAAGPQLGDTLLDTTGEKVEDQDCCSPSLPAEEK